MLARAAHIPFVTVLWPVTEAEVENNKSTSLGKEGKKV